MNVNCAACGKPRAAYQPQPHGGWYCNAECATWAGTDLPPTGGGRFGDFVHRADAPGVVRRVATMALLQQAATTLGVTLTDSWPVTRAAYRRAAKQTHPDVAGGSVAAYRRVQTAFALLGALRDWAVEAPGSGLPVPERVAEPEAQPPGPPGEDRP
jgi:hypothetical protein